MSPLSNRAQNDIPQTQCMTPNPVIVYGRRFAVVLLSTWSATLEATISHLNVVNGFSRLNKIFPDLLHTNRTIFLTA